MILANNNNKCKSSSRCKNKRRNKSRDRCSRLTRGRESSIKGRKSIIALKDSNREDIGRSRGSRIILGINRIFHKKKSMKMIMAMDMRMMNMDSRRIITEMPKCILMPEKININKKRHNRKALIEEEVKEIIKVREINKLILRLIPNVF